MGNFPDESKSIDGGGDENGVGHERLVFGGSLLVKRYGGFVFVEIYSGNT